MGVGDSEMELMYAKLHEKYKKLKKRRFSELENYSHEQNTKFMNYVSVAEDMIGYLKSENGKLQVLVNGMKDQMTSKRSDLEDKFVEYQDLLIEESAKTKELSADLERLRNQLAEGCQHNNNNGNNNHMQMECPSGGPQSGSNNLIRSPVKEMALKPLMRHFGIQTDNVSFTPYDNGTEEHAAIKESESDKSSNDAHKNHWQLDCYGRSSSVSEDAAKDPINASCLFQTLVECLVGMKFSIVNQTEGLKLSVLHPSSGYSFSLTWPSEAVGGKAEAEVHYRLLSLGTLSRVAQEWMKEDIIFSTSMCSIFFERVSRVTGVCR